MAGDATTNLTAEPAPPISLKSLQETVAELRLRYPFMGARLVESRFMPEDRATLVGADGALAIINLKTGAVTLVPPSQLARIW